MGKGYYDGNLYHYCKLDTFEKILESKKIRLCDITKSNDSTETKWLIQMFHDILPSPIFDVNNITKNNRQKYFVFCLSTEKNSLSQWRGYGDDGSGVAIGFNVLLFEYLFESCNHINKNTSLMFGCVDYSTSNQLAFLRNLMSNSFKINKGKDEHINYIIKNSFPDAIFMKHTAFRDEKEWRLVFKCTDNDYTNLNIPYFDKVDYYIRNNEKIPFISLDISCFENAISKIIVGPNCKAGKSEIKKLLEENGIFVDNNSIILSQIPYVNNH